MNIKRNEPGDIRAEIIRHLGPYWESIVIWAVGEDYRVIDFIAWPNRISARTGVLITLQDTFEDTCKKLRDKWIDMGFPGPTPKGIPNITMG